MTIPVRVPLHLRRRPEAGEPVAVFLPGRDASALLSACARLGIDPSRRVHAVAGGFVVELDRPAAGSFVLPGAVRLRELAPGLLVPVDAELVPALLDDERAGLVRDGGLVFLPDGRVLRYDRRATVALSTLVEATPAPRRDWQPLPEPRRLADRIVEIARDEPDESPEAIYEQMSQNWRDPGASGRPARDPRKSGRGEEGAGETESASGAGLGGALRGLFSRAGAGARSLGESMQWSGLNQSQLLQKLLREFRQGDSSRALRHALPISPVRSGGRSFVPLGGRLPFSRAIYNLMELLGGPRRGQDVGVWSAPPDLVAELTREYHRLAEAAQRQGDYRRAAYIYGKLLGDDRAAAVALRRGGLDHDAAILLLVKVRDEAAAAEAFEAAGEFERAIALYMKLRRHEQAGDLLRRLGYEDAAGREYLFAVAMLQDRDGPTDYLEVGRICGEKLRDTELAVAAYVCGWTQRPGPNATACALRLIRIHAARGGGEPIARLLDEADVFLRDRGAHDARDFYNQVAAIAADDAGAGLAVVDIRDRALRVMAHHVRRLAADTGGATAPVVSTLFADSTLWTPAIARDAQFAAARASAARRPSLPVREPTSIAPLRARVMRVGRGTVTAAASAPAAFEGVLGFDDGQI
ncbi:MAG: tetratricopeptide repeat protein, partial [Isosphaeraceae bacterium]